MTCHFKNCLEHSSSSSTTTKSSTSTTPKKIVTHASSTPETTTHKLVTQNLYRPTLETPAIITSIKKPSSILTTTPHYLPSTHKPYEYDELTDDVDYEYEDEYFTTNSKELLNQQNENQSKLSASSKSINTLFLYIFFLISFLAFIELQKTDSHEHSPLKLFSQPVHFSNNNNRSNIVNHRKPSNGDNDYIDKPLLNFNFDIKRNNNTHHINISNTSSNGVIMANQNYQTNDNHNQNHQSIIDDDSNDQNDDHMVIKPAVSFQQQHFQNGGTLTVTNSHVTVNKIPVNVFIFVFLC